MIDQKELCVLSTLLLHSAKSEVTPESLARIADHLKQKVDGYLLELFSGVGRDTLESIIRSPSGSAATSAAPAEAAKEEAKKEETEEEDEGSDDFDLF